ncbi:hypothetical protein BpHYR1_049821 [Brachionus plicatilis]|uniref:Uncharacterized protein n=1 Tax=Brachionus plicatilis TaxID=10195 RepID=A0A3M7RID5_BRAPC|nr:hypothetical protein BpHYR1_049821 [Brachionus plicatilis]
MKISMKNKNFLLNKDSSVQILKSPISISNKLTLNKNRRFYFFSSVGGRSRGHVAGQKKKIGSFNGQ